MAGISRRLARAEARAQRAMIHRTAAEYGITSADFMEEAEAFFAMSLDAQLAEVDRIAAELQAHGMTMDNIDDIKATLIREYRP